jgi:hypothetical protein
MELAVVFIFRLSCKNKSAIRLGSLLISLPVAYPPMSPQQSLAGADVSDIARLLPDRTKTN